MFRRAGAVSLPQNDQLISLLRKTAPNEVTIYIKGFLTRGETSDDFSNWKNSHLNLCTSSLHGWEHHASGYSWQNESFKSHFDHISSILPEIKNLSPYRLPYTIPIPVVTVTAGAASLFYRLLQGKKLLSPLGFVIATTQDIALIAAQLMSQYYRARSNAINHAPFLTQQIKNIKQNHPNLYIRVVAHSLGSKLALESVDQTENVIDELHLLAPAITHQELEEVMEHHQGELPVSKTYIYYSHYDRILEIFGLLEGDHAIGYQGLQKKYPGITHYDVSEHLEGINKHRSYSWTFHKFIKTGQ